MSLFLRVTNAEGTTFKVRYQFGLMNSKDQKIQYFHDVEILDAQEFESGLGYRKFLTHAELCGVYKKYVVDWKITIACKVS